MRRSLLAVPVVVLALAVPAGWAAARGAGTLSVEDGLGMVTVKGTGTLVGRMERGEILIVDLTPGDQWSPRLNGVPRGRLAGLRGRTVNFYVPGGRYQVTLRGEGISLSARGSGVARVKARADVTVPVGTYAVGDDARASLPDELTRVVFGTATSDDKGTP
jgi:hypothetical protein